MGASDPKTPAAEPEESLLYRIGCRISELGSNLAAHPFAQAGVIIFSATWFTLGLDTGLLTAALSILAITLSQMVLNRQNVREAEAHRRDVAMHAKLDELVIAVRAAHNEMAGIEELPEDVIVELKEHTLEVAASSGDADTAKRSSAKPSAARRKRPVR